MRSLGDMYDRQLDDLLRRASFGHNQGDLTDSGFMAISKAVMATKQVIEQAIAEGRRDGKEDAEAQDASA